MSDARNTSVEQREITPVPMNRAKLQPGLALAAEAACIYRSTDGFCHPRNVDSCKCWDQAKQVMEATGLSARAVAWIFRNSQRIEELAKP
jgi:hypothetical protein